MGMQPGAWHGGDKLTHGTHGKGMQADAWHAMHLDSF